MARESFPGHRRYLSEAAEAADLRGLVRTLFLAGALAVSGLTLTGVSAQETPASLSFAPAPGPLTPGTQATFVLGVGGAQRLFGADIEVTFDPTAAAVVDADPAKEGVQVQIGPFLDPGFVVYNVADNAAGKLRVTFTQVAPKAPASGAGGLISFDLKATGGGDPKLRVSAALLARDDGTSQPVAIAATGATPVAPQGSPVANPTQIRTPAGNSPASQGGQATPASQQTTPPASVGAPAPGDPGLAPLQQEDGDSLPGWAVGGLVAGTLLVLAGLGLVGRKYLKRIGVNR